MLLSRQPQQGRGTGPDGGKKNGQIRVGMDPLPNLDNAMAIRDTVARLLSDVYSGNLPPRIAAGLAPLMQLQLRVLEKTEIEKRLGKLEQLMREGIMENRKASAAEEMREKVEPGPDSA